MSYHGLTTPRKKRAKRFKSTKIEHDTRKQYERTHDEMMALVKVAQLRQLTQDEGKELNRLSSKVRRLEIKLTKKNL